MPVDVIEAKNKRGNKSEYRREILKAVAIVAHNKTAMDA